MSAAVAKRDVVDLPASFADDFVGTRKSPRRRRADRRESGITDGQMALAHEDAKRAMRTGDWTEATPRHLVALYEILHTRVYGVAPAELTPMTRMHAAGAAARMLTKEFAGDVGKMATFLRWTWVREEKREKWRRQNGQAGGRIGWKLQFLGTLLTDYRVDHVRRHS